MSSKWDDLAFILSDIRWNEPEVVEHFKQTIQDNVPAFVRFGDAAFELLRESKHLLCHEAGCMAGWAEVGVVYEDKRCSCHVGAWNAKVDAVLK